MNRDSVAALFMLCLSLGYGWETRSVTVLPFQVDAPMTARTLPYVVSGAGVLVSLTILLSSMISKQESPAVATYWHGRDWKRTTLFLAVVACYGLAIGNFGFIVPTVVFLCVCSVILGERRIHLLLGIYVPIVLIFWYVMTQLLDVTL